MQHGVRAEQRQAGARSGASAKREGTAAAQGPVAELGEIEHHAYGVSVLAPRERVWEALRDFGGSRWAPTVERAPLLTDEATGIGAMRRIEHVRVGELQKRIVEWDEGRGFAYELEALPAPILRMRNEWALTTDADQTLVTIEQGFDLELGENRALLLPVARRAAAHELMVTLAGLKHHVETGKDVTPEFLADASRAVRERNTAAVRELSGTARVR